MLISAEVAKIVLAEHLNYYDPGSVYVACNKET